MYAKIFTTLFDGSMRGHADLILVFVNLLCHCDEDGVVDRHWRAIADEVGLPEERVRKTLLALEAPDPESRTRTKEGRRIERIDPARDWGWSVVNYEHYRNLQTAEKRREYMREYMKSRRAKQAKSRSKKPVNKCKQPLAKVAQVEVDTDTTTSSYEDNPPPPASPCLTEPSPAPTPVPAPPSPKPRNGPRKADPPAGPGKDTSPPPPATQGQRRRSWLDDFDEVWMGKYGGHMIFGQAGKVLKPLRELHGHEKTLAAWRVYIGKTEAEYASPNRFCSTFGTYLPAEPPPRPKMPVEWGNSPAGVR